jgi:uncharacterized phage-associated protein
MFREDKTSQMAARYLKMAGGRMQYILLLKLLYLADKQMLVRWGKPITYDKWCSMKCGPVLSATYDLIKEDRTGGNDTLWSRFIRTEGNDVVLINDPGDDDLSRAEDAILQSVYKERGKDNVWKLIEELHKELPEWEDPGLGSKPIQYQTVLAFEGLSEEEITDILDNIETQDCTARIRVA